MDGKKQPQHNKQTNKQTNKTGQIVTSDIVQDFVSIICEVPLNNMFGYSTDLR